MAVANPSSGASVRLRTLVFVRSLGIIGQIVAIFIVFFGLKYQMPIGQCLMVIAVAIAFNAVMLFLYPSIHMLSEREASAHLAFDIMQLTAMLALTGGIENPFAILYLAPVVISATNLSLTSTLRLALLAFISISVIAFLHWPLPWDPQNPLLLPPLYIAGVWIALTLGIGFCLIYAWRTAEEARLMQTALAATQSALEREQRLSDLGALAAAAAHELGTPLGTIAVVARELERDMPAGSAWSEDVKLLRSQAERCREILTRLSQQGTGADENTVAQRLPLAALIDEIAEPHRGFGIDVNVHANGTGALVVVRNPEVVHGIGNLIENAVDFANTRVDIEAVWTDEKVDMTISDDGTGFNAEILARLGEPYVTSRAGLESNRKEGAPANLHADGHAGMGLGFFIAKTLIERIGGTISFGNKPKGGAIVRMSLPRKNLESPANSRG
ncbi:MAG: ActS/PrrB/RegB family redox-sensitive histidine kinase [Alphaproteobacteria bacterium]|nr:ActS/PrrB/RegB family redox-sensitive histidine kinase [Alphaproteobacteria bacterium]